MSNQPSISGLQSQLEDATTPKQRVDLLNLIVEQLRYKDPEQSIVYAEEARSLAAIADSGMSPYFEGLICSLLHLTYVYQWMGQYQKCIEFGEEALSHSVTIDNKLYQANALTQLGHGNTRLGYYPTAYEYYTSAIRLAQLIEDKKTHCSARLGLGVLTSELGNHQDAITHFQLALKIAREQNLEPHHSLLLNNIAFVQYKLGAYYEVFPYAFEARKIAQENNTQVTLNLINTIIAGAYIETNQYEKARSYLEPNLDDLRQTSDKKALSLAYQVLAKLYLHDQKTNEAMTALFDALKIAEEIAIIDDQYEIHEMLAGVYEQRGDLDRAFFHFRQFHELKETVFSQHVEQRLRVLEVIHQTEKARQNAEIYRLKTEALEQMVDERTAALTKRSAELSESLAREQSLAQQLSETLKKEEELSNLKSRIIETVSHEFRTPLAVINTSSQLLKRNLDRLSPEKNETYFQRISEAVFFINDLIDDAAFLSQTSRAPLNPVWMVSEVKAFCLDLDVTLQDEYEQVETFLFKINVPENLKIVTDFQLAYHCLANLVSNAHKYGVDDGTIQISTEVIDDRLQIHVKDEGIGVPVGEEQKIFELFYRASNVGHRRGLGLGLTIAQRICQILEGEIRVESAGEGQGSMFTLILPLEPSTYDGV